MTAPKHSASLEDVLDAFAVEEDIGRQTLERYLRVYPEYASDLIELSRELSRMVVHNEAPLSAEDNALISKAWQRHAAAAPVDVVDPFAMLSVDDWRKVAERLGVPRQVISAFRERRVALASVPRRFLAQFADAVNSSIEQLSIALALPAIPSAARSYKADTKPIVPVDPVPFEQILIEAGVSTETRAVLMANEA